MTQKQINAKVEKQISRDRVGGYSLEQLWHGIHPDQRYQVVFAIRELIEAGKAQITEKRVFDGVGNAETVTSYCKVCG